MARIRFRRQRRFTYAKVFAFCPGLLLALGLLGCSPDSDTGTAPLPPNPNDPAFVEQGINEVVNLYQSGLSSGDIDQLQPLLRQADTSQSATTLGRIEKVVFLPDGCSELTALTVAPFRKGLIHLLQRFRVVSHDTEMLEMDTTADEPTVTLRETISLEDTTSSGNTRLAQRTCVSNLTLRVTRQDGEVMEALPGLIATDFLIKEVIREGPVFQLDMPGRAEANALARIEVKEVTNTFSIQSVTLSSEDQSVSLQPDEDDVFRGAFKLADEVSPTSFQVTIGGASDEEVKFEHTYQTLSTEELAVQRVPGTVGIMFRTLAEGATERFGLVPLTTKRMRIRTRVSIKSDLKRYPLQRDSHLPSMPETKR